MAAKIILRWEDEAQEVSKRDLLDWLNDLADDNIDRGILHGSSEAEIKFYASEYKAYRRALCAYIQNNSAEGAPCVLDMDKITNMPIVPGFAWTK